MKQLQHVFVVNKIKDYITQNIKNRSSCILRLWSNHCEYIVAQRFRRGQQVFSLYSKIWDDTAFKELLKYLRKQFQRHAKGMILGSTGLFIFEWDKERIPLDSLRVHSNEFDEINILKSSTIECNCCKKRLIFDMKVDGVDYCSCNTKQIIVKNVDYNKDWTPYIERKNMIIWRKEEKPGLYAYKVYVKYNDISAEDFLHVQTDINYRKEWDNTAISLDLIDSDPDTNSDVIYWEMLWPKLFSNRDYVFARRFMVDNDKNVIIIVSKSVEHPSCPEKSQNQRVNEYWSYMVIKPKDNFKKSGLEFVLTYFDNPGISLPQTITSWVAQSQMPEFLTKLYEATKVYSTRRRNEDENLYSLEKYSDPDYEYSHEEYIDANGVQLKNTVLNEIPSEQSEQQQSQKETSWWSYLHPYTYFA